MGNEEYKARTAGEAGTEVKTVHYDLELPSYNHGMSEEPLVGVVMGSKSDYEVMSAAVEILKALEIPYEAKVVSAHRTPDLLFRVCGDGAGARFARDHCGSRRRGAPAGDAGGEDAGSGAGRAGGGDGAARDGLRCFRLCRCRRACRWGR